MERVIDSDYWHSRANEQTIDTLPGFIKELKEEFKNQDHFSNNGEHELTHEEREHCMENGFIVMVLLMRALESSMLSEYYMNHHQIKAAMEVVKTL